MTEPSPRAPPSARYTIATVNFPAGESLSSVLNCGTGAPVMFRIPDDWTSAQVSFQTSPDATNFFDLFDRSAREVSFNVVPGTAVLLDQGWAPVLYLRVRSGMRNSPVPQKSARQVGFTLDTTPSY
jgi:hypothetical protein